MAFQEAVKAKSWLRLAIQAPAGGGKTFSALRVATGMQEEMKKNGVDTMIGVIDTEHGSASLYADRFKFVTDTMKKPYSIDQYIQSMREAYKAGIKILIIDSLSHAWQELLEEVDKLANTKYKGNTFRAWSEGTPKQRKLVEAILAYPGHIIVTMRAKTEYSVQHDGNKTVIQRVGLQAEQGKGIEFEFSMLWEGDINHNFHCTKDRTGKYQDQILEMPGEEVGTDLIQWLNTGADLREEKKDTVATEKKGQKKTSHPGAQKTSAKKALQIKLEKTYGVATGDMLEMIQFRFGSPKITEQQAAILLEEISDRKGFEKFQKEWFVSMAGDPEEDVPVVDEANFPPDEDEFYEEEEEKKASAGSLDLK